MLKKPNNENGVVGSRAQEAGVREPDEDFRRCCIHHYEATGMREGQRGERMVLVVCWSKRCADVVRAHTPALLPTTSKAFNPFALQGKRFDAFIPCLLTSNMAH